MFYRAEAGMSAGCVVVWQEWQRMAAGGRRRKKKNGSYSDSYRRAVAP